MVDKSDRSVCRVHRSDEINIGRNSERLVVTCQRNALSPVLQEIHELAKDAGEISSIDLVDNQCAWRVFARVTRLRTELHESAWQSLEQKLTFGHHRANALHEVLVTVGRVELYCFDGSERLADEEARETFRYQRVS